MIQTLNDPRYSECTALVLCPRCHSECKEIWLSHTTKGLARKDMRRMYVICKNDKCMFDLATVKQPGKTLKIEKKKVSIDY